LLCRPPTNKAADQRLFNQLCCPTGCHISISARLIILRLIKLIIIHLRRCPDLCPWPKTSSSNSQRPPLLKPLTSSSNGNARPTLLRGTSARNRPIFGSVKITVSLPPPSRSRNNVKNNPLPSDRNSILTHLTPIPPKLRIRSTLTSKGRGKDTGPKDWPTGRNSSTIKKNSSEAARRRKKNQCLCIPSVQSLQCAQPLLKLK
jgi:hypothetical protein